MTCDACGFDVPPFTGQHTGDDVICADCLAKYRANLEAGRGRIIPVHIYADDEGIARTEAGDTDAVGVARSDVAGLQAVSPAQDP